MRIITPVSKSYPKLGYNNFSAGPLEPEIYTLRCGMGRHAKGGLSQVAGKGYRVTVGAHQGEDGKIRPRTFWLGHDRIVAEFAAEKYRNGWDYLRTTSTTNVWPFDLIQKIQEDVVFFKNARNGLFEQYKREKAAIELKTAALQEVLGTPAPTKPTNVAKANPKTAMLYGAIAEFLESFKGKRRSDRHKQRMEQVLEVNLKHIRKDCPLSEIDFLWLDRLCDHFKSRPANQKDGKPLSASSIRGILTYLRLFFTWMDDVQFGRWEMPRRGLKCFKIRIGDLMTSEEVKQAGTIKQFTIDTLKILYVTANSRMRGLLLTSLFTGATQNELALMTKDEFNLETAMLKHVRHKTKVAGEYWLPPELVTLLKAEFAARPNDKLVWRTEDGRPLVSYKDAAQTSDAVRQAWDDLREKAGIPKALPFKYLRKFLADWMTAHGGEEMGQVAMSHSRQTVLARNYSTARPFERFHDLQRQMYAELTAAKFFDIPKAEKAKDRDAKA